MSALRLHPVPEPATVRWAPRVIRLLLALLAALLLSACSVVKIAYNNAADLSYWWLDEHMDFNEAQALVVRADLNALMAWHRANELPLYANFLEKLERVGPGKVTPDQVCELYADVRTRFQTLLERTEGPVAALAPTFTAQQLEHMAHQFDKRNQKWRNEWGDTGDRNARRIKQLADSAETLYGSLDDTQLAALRASNAVSDFKPELAHGETLRRQQDTLQTLRQVQGGKLRSPDSASARIHALFNRTLHSPDPAYQRYLQHITQESCKAYANLHNSISPAQRQRALGNLKSWEADLRSLAGSPR